MGIFDSFDEINFDELPDQFVLKCTHDSGGLIICKDKSKLDIASAKSKINDSLKNNYYLDGREWPYKNVKPRILCEKYMVDESGYELKDYKFFCFDGVAKFLFEACDRGVEGEEVKFDFYDINWKHLPIKQGHENYEGSHQKPNNFDEMIAVAEKLSKGFPHVRVDLYNINGKIYFGEMTFFHFSGVVPFQPAVWDEVFGSWITLPNQKI